jgi:hypothetical protein
MDEWIDGIVLVSILQKKIKRVHPGKREQQR